MVGLSDPSVHVLLPPLCHPDRNDSDAPSHAAPCPSRSRPSAYLPNGAPRADKLVDDVGGDQGHGGERDAPPHPVGPEREDVVVVGERLEVDDAHHHHKLGAGGAEGRRRRETRSRERAKGGGGMEGEKQGRSGRSGERCVRWITGRGHKEGGEEKGEGDERRIQEVDDHKRRQRQRE